VVLSEGVPSDGLYVILDGTADVAKRSGVTEVPAGRLHEGDLFGEASCLHRAAATATVTMRRAGSLLRLPRADFDALVTTYPPILELVSALSDERTGTLRAVVAGKAWSADDGLLLI